MSVCVVLVLSLISGCGAATVSEENIELLDPVGVSANYVKAEVRDLVAYKTYAGKVVPVVLETSFASDQRFSNYSVLPGSVVKAGDAIISANTDSIDKQIDALKDKIKEAKENFDEQIKDLNDSVELTKREQEYILSILDNFKRMSLSDKMAYYGNADGHDNGGPYSESSFNNKYTNTVATLQRLEEQIKETTELYIVDAEYNQLCLKNLQNDRKNVLATAPIDGTVVSSMFFDNNQYIQKNIPVAGVADFSELVVKTETVYRSDVKKAVEYYGLVNGKRYEANFVTKDIKVQNNNPNSTTVGGGNYSTFELIDPNGEIKAGDTATIVLINTVREAALCVPTEAISKDEEGSFVYVFDGNKNNYTPVKTGIKNGFYTEILSGLNEGDLVVSEFTVKEKTKTTTLSKGKIGATFKGTGYIFYPKEERIVNTVKYGTTYIDELCVKLYEKVEKGQVLARVRVTADDIAIKRLERQILRANENLNEMIEAAKDKEDKNEKLINLAKEAIDEQNKTLAEMKRDSKVTEIKAPYSGIITSTGYYEEGDILFTDAFICSLAAEENCFVVVEDKAGQLTVGNVANVEYMDYAAQSNAIAKGDVITVSSCAVSSELNVEAALIRVAPEDFSKMAGTRGDNGWWSRASFTVTADIRTINDVLLVPKTAVTVENEIPYVTVLDENGKCVYKSFVAGGSDSSNYWVVDGLSEGTTICLE